MAIGWVLPEVAPAASVTRTYFASFSADLKIADIGASSAVSVATAEVGDTFEYTLTVDNEIGPDIADAVTVEFPLPAGVTLKSQSGTGTYDPQTGRWAAGDVALKGAASITLTVEATGVGTQTAQVLYASPKLAIDMTPVDATSTETNVVEVSDRFDASQSQIAATPTTLAADGQRIDDYRVDVWGDWRPDDSWRSDGHHRKHTRHAERGARQRRRNLHRDAVVHGLRQRDRFGHCRRR